jgi:nifR3 family TIM-barrel protein
MTVANPQPALTEPFWIGDVEIENRVLLAPLAGIGNWFVRLQSRRYGAGLAVSEMISSFGLHYGDERTHREFLRLHPDEHPVALQLFGQEPEVMASAARTAAEAGADIIDINMGCPVRKVLKTGSGAALIDDPDRAVALCVAAREGSGLPVTCKVRSGTKTGDTRGLDLAVRLVEDGGAAAIGFHPRSAQVHHKGEPDYALARRLSEAIEVPMIISGGLSDAEAALHAYEASGADAVMIARGALGYPWIFGELTGKGEAPQGNEEVVAELFWVMDSAADHLGPDRAARYLRKFYPWYVERLMVDDRKALDVSLQQSDSLEDAREMVIASTGVEVESLPTLASAEPVATTTATTP